MTMKAGRELDAIIAEKVMGGIGPKDPLWNGDVGVKRTVTRVTRVDPISGIVEVGESWEYPEYSTDIAAAWQVVDKMRAQGIGFGICDSITGDLWCAIFYADYGCEGVAGTAPHAICLAALQVGVQYE